MSHFIVAVFTENEFQDIDDLLAPYDESVVVEPYVDATKEELIQHQRERMQSIYENQYAEWQRNPAAYEKRAHAEHIEYLRSLPKHMKQTDEQLYAEAIEGYSEDDITPDGAVLSQYNPDSKWDWYTIGGRWQGMLKLKPGKTGERGESGIMSKMSVDYDAAYAADIDFDAMRESQYGHIQPYKEALKNGFYTEEYMRERYPSELEYYQHMTAFNTYAVITPDGVWHAPGDMGCFGMSSDSATGRRSWEDEYYDRFIKPALTNGWYLTIVAYKPRAIYAQLNAERRYFYCREENQNGPIL